MMLTGQGLADYAVSLLGSPYVYGINGSIVTEELIQRKAMQYPNYYTPGYIEKARQFIGQPAYDCSSITDLYTGTDRSANGWLASCVEKGPISTLPDIVGPIVHKDHHMGVYIGQGYAVEARGIDYGVVKTRVAERPWTSWGKLTGLEYTAPGEYTQEETNMLYRDCPAGEAVLRWQESLTRCGITTDADGDFGPQTEIQTKAFQIAVGLPESGKVDDVTYARMLAELLSIKPVEVPTGIPQSALDSLATQRDDLAKDLQSAVERADALQAQCDTETRISAERAQIAANYLADCKQFAQAETVKQGLVTKYINR